MTSLSANTIAFYAQRTTGGKAFRCSARTAAHIDATKARLATAYPASELQIVQGCYNSTVAASVGTHDGDAVLDFRITGIGWWAAQRFLRECGWAAWYRHTGVWAAERNWHLHAVSLGYTTKVGVYVPGQVIDYYNHRSGLVGHVPDASWHPINIAATVFDYDAYLKEIDMPSPKDWDADDWKAVDSHIFGRIINSAGDGKHQFSSLFATLYNKVVGK